MEQTAKVFASLNPQIMHGLENWNQKHPLLVSTIQTASRRDLEPDVIIIDEIHYGFEGVMIEKLMKDKPNARIIGLSATPYDKNGKLLSGFKLILDKYDLKYMIQNSYLVPLEAYQLVHIRNLDKVKVIGGDYNLKELSKVVSNNQTILEIVDSSLDYIAQYKKAIVFAVDINHAELLAKAYQHADINAVALHSKMTQEAINSEIERFTNGEIKVLVSVLMLTTGFDVPDTDLAIIARPTKSQNLYKQMVGRILRIAPNKTHAVLLDCGNVIENLGEPLDPIKETEIKQTSNKHTCPMCHSENLKLKKEADCSYWICQECHHKQEIEKGAYECKICKRKYTSDAQFSINNNKLFLVCETCPYPTLISEFSGDEVFVAVSPKRRPDYLPFEEARKIVRQMGFKSKKDWQQFIGDKGGLRAKLPSNIPTNPYIIYQNSGWINLLDWLGITKNEGVIINSQYLPFEEAKRFVIALNLNSVDEWSKYCNNKLEGYTSRPETIPQKPQVLYKHKGWVDFEDWLGLDVKKTNKLKLIQQYVQEQNILKLSEILATNKSLVQEESIRYIFNFLNKDSLINLVDLLDYSDKAVFMNLALENNSLEIFNVLSSISYKIKKTDSARKLYENILKFEGSSEEDICSKIEVYNQEDFNYYVLVSLVERESIVKVFENYQENISEDMLQKIAHECSSNRIFILDQAIQFGRIDLASKIVSLDIDLDQYYDEHDKSIKALEKIITLFPLRWKNFDASFIFWFMENDVEPSYCCDIQSSRNLFDLLSIYEIAIDINYTRDTQSGLLNIICYDALELFELLYENTLIHNYKICDLDFLGWAIFKSAHKIIEFLISKDFKIVEFHFYLAIEVNIDISVIKKLYRTDFNINRLFNDANTLLHIAYKNQNMDIVKYLLELNADKTILNNQGRLAMDILKEM